MNKWINWLSQSPADKDACDFGRYAELWKSHMGGCQRIIRITEDYIVLIDKRNNIDWETTPKFDGERSKEGRQENEKVLSQCLITEHKPTAGLNKATLLSFKAIIGEAIVNCLEGNCESSLEILKQADEFRLDRVVEKSRSWYLSYTVAISTIVILAILAANRIPLGPAEAPLQHLNIGAWAVAGSCLSIILRSGRLQHASYAGRQLHFIESGCRLIGGFISGQIVLLGIQSGIIFANFVGSDNAQDVVSFLALLAGASERFAPSIITKIEESPSFTEPAKENCKMASRKALIVGSPDDKIPGVKIDVKALNDYLKSPIGGLWFDSEITVLTSPSASTLMSQIGLLKSSDYSLVFFGGHGYYSAERKRTILKINAREEFDSLELRAGAMKHTLILDCCRKIESERRLVEAAAKSMTLDSIRGQALNPMRCRRHFDQAISECDSGLVVMNACSINEGAGESATEGGYYTSSLIDAGEEWAKKMLATVSLLTHPGTFSTQNSHDAATARVRLLSGGRQTPSFEAPRAERKFPFTVVA